MSNVCLYHASCSDGFTAAWVVHRFYYGDVECIPCSHAPGNSHEPPWERIAPGDNVVIVDFSFRRDVMLRLAQHIGPGGCLVVLDHHATAEAELGGLYREALDTPGTCATAVEFDMERSGAGMAWDHFYRGEPRPWVVNYVEDRDLWRFALPHTHEANAYIMSLPWDFSAWSNLPHPADAIAEGRGILRYKQRQRERVLKNARTATIAGHEVPCVNTPVFQSEVCNDLAEGHPFAAAWFQRADGTRQWSLRSSHDGGLDVGAIARSLGGGGHKHAAGFVEVP